MYNSSGLSRSALVLIVCLVSLPTACLGQTAASGDPPFGGTIFIDPDIVTPADPTAFQGVAYVGQGTRTMYDRRVNNWISVEAYLIDATFADGLSTEIQVNPEFGSAEAALAQAQRFAPFIGQLPTALRADVETVWIHLGVEPFGGGNNNLLIHIGQADLYEDDGILEETLVHEAAHTSLDAYHADAQGWLDAQAADDTFISTYARDYPTREDVAESFLPYLAVRYRADRISQQLHDTIVQAIPNRIAYFDAQSLNMYPVEPTGVATEDFEADVPGGPRLAQNYPNPFNPVTTVSFELAKPGGIRLAVFDLLGKTVAVLASGDYPAGRHEVAWDASGAPSGLYVYQLQTATSSRMRKMLLSK